MMHLAVLGSTRGTDMQAIIDAIESKKLDAQIDIVISNKPDAYILERATKHGIKNIFIDASGKTREEYDKLVLKELKKFKINLILLIGYMRIVSGVLVYAYKDKILNVHPSLLPAFAGGMDKNVHAEVLKAGVKNTGCTIHYVDEGVDTGRVLLKKKCKVDPDETVETLKAKVQKLEGEAFIEVIQMLIKKTI